MVQNGTTRRRIRREQTGLSAAVGGMLLIAATYGMARFGVGLFVPLLAATRPALTGGLGWAAAAQFLSYSVAAIVAARLVDRHPRSGLLLAGATATIGCLGVAVATEPVVLVLAVLTAGLGGGFASPALVPIVDGVVAERAASTGQSLVNAGTAVGVIGAGLVSFTATSVGPSWTFIAVLCVLATAAAWYPVRSRSDLGADSRATGSSPAALPSDGGVRALLVPATAAIVIGAGSALVWTFGPLLVTGAGAVGPDVVGWLWIALGVGGFLGIGTGALVDRIGLRGGWITTTTALALATASVGLSIATSASVPALAGMALFGAGYMGASGVLILCARDAWPTRAGAATSVLFVALAVGQMIGTAGFEAVRGAAAPVGLALVAAVLCGAGGVAGLRRR